MTGTGSAITSTPLSEHREPTIFPITVLGTISPYLKVDNRAGFEKNKTVSRTQEKTHFKTRKRAFKAILFRLSECNASKLISNDE